MKLPTQLRILNSCPPASLFLPSVPPFQCSRPVLALSQVLPFRLKRFVLMSRRPDHIGVRSMSTRQYRPKAAGSSFGEGAKSLIDDEAELSDWVSEIRSGEGSSGGTARGRGGGGGRGRGGGRNGDGGRGAFAMNRTREGGSEDFGGSSRSRGRTANPSLGRRGGRDSGSGFRQDRGTRNANSSMGRRGGSGLDSGFRRDRDAGEDFRKSRYETQKVQVLEEEDDDVYNEDMEAVRGGIGNLLNEEDSDVDGDDFVGKSTGSLFGVKKDKQSSSGNDGSYLSETRFDQCSLSPMSLRSIKDAGYEKMTMVQEASLPVILKGKDVMAKAKTGTGKTVAFLLPSIEMIVKSPPADRNQRNPPVLVLVICPTRELATQAAVEAGKLLKYHPSIGVQVVIGGTSVAVEQRRMQANPCQILVATPGRLKDHIENTPGFATKLAGLKVLVLDEADHLLDMGFRRDIERIIAAVPKQRQTLLFSATIPDEVRQICHIALKRDHEFINTVQEGSGETHSQVRQTHLVAPLDKHFSIMYALLKDHIADDVDYKVLVFCTTAMVTRMVADFLGQLKLNVREIHSRKSQSYRTKVSDEFRKSTGLILVTSDVSARGVDYPDVTLVIQVGVPSDREQYIHRLGRTGRKGKEGQGILLLAPWEEFFLSSIKDLPISKAPEPLVDPDTKKKVERALANMEMDVKEKAYQTWLGYYNSYKKIGNDKVRLVQLANEFSRSMGCDVPPAIKKVIVGKMGLKNVPGLRTL